MARVDLHGFAHRLGIAVCICALLAACNRRNDEQQAAPKRFSGVIDDRYYVHPRANGNGRTVVKGCCTFDIGQAQVTQLPGDVDGRLVRGQGYQLEIAFGSRLSPLPPGFRSDRQRRLDGVNVTEFEGGSQRYALQATVPLSDEAARQRIDFPQLQVVGGCETAAGCRELERVLGSIRF